MTDNETHLPSLSAAELPDGALVMTSIEFEDGGQSLYRVLVFEAERIPAQSSPVWSIADIAQSVELVVAIGHMCELYADKTVYHPVEEGDEIKYLVADSITMAEAATAAHGISLQGPTRAAIKKRDEPVRCVIEETEHGLYLTQTSRHDDRAVMVPADEYREHMELMERVQADQDWLRSLLNKQ